MPTPENGPLICLECGGRTFLDNHAIIRALQADPALDNALDIVISITKNPTMSARIVAALANHIKKD
jgi:hypothetical protein